MAASYGRKVLAGRPFRVWHNEAMPSSVDTLSNHGPCQGCAYHRQTGSGCAIVEKTEKTEQTEKPEQDTSVPLDAFLERDPCYLKQELKRFCQRYLSHRPRVPRDADDLFGDTIACLLSEARVRAGGFAYNLRSFMGYVRRVAVRCAITAERRESGRLRCGNCLHYGAWSGKCLASGHAWTHCDVGIEQDPRKLEPPCRQFSTRKGGRALTDELLAVASGGDEEWQDRLDVIDAVHSALRELAQSHPRAALVIRALFLEGKRYEDLGHLGMSTRTLKRDRALALEILQRRLRPFFEEKVAQTSAPERSPRQENE